MLNARMVERVLALLLVVPGLLKLVVPGAGTEPLPVLIDLVVAIGELGAGLLLLTPRWRQFGALSCFVIGVGWLVAGMFVTPGACRCFGVASAAVTPDLRLLWASVTVVLAGVALDATRRS